MRSKSESDPTDHPLLLEAIECFGYGFFDGAVKRCEQLERLSPELEVASTGVSWFSRVYSGRREFLEAARRSPFVKQVVGNAGQGGQGVAELVWLYFDSWDGDKWQFPNGIALQQKGPYQQVLNFIDNQHGVLVSFHPTALLWLAELAEKSSEVQIAKSLTNSALGWRSRFTRGEDLERLARLLVVLKAPGFVWADWAVFYFQHVRLMHGLATRASEFIAAKDFAEWAARQDAESQHVLARVFGFAPPELLDVMSAMNPYFGWEGFDNAVLAVATESLRAGTETSLKGISKVSSGHSWYDHPDIHTRYFWFDMLDEHEKAFVTNGDWALGCTPTDDYSMGLAQWWRLIESVFGRIVRNDLGKLYDDHPEWLSQDLDNLSKNAQSSEAVFLKKLAVSENREKMTLVDILRVLEKCVLKPRTQSDNGSVVRQKATEFFAPHAKVLSNAIVSDGSLPFLTDETVNWFRNRASHSSPMGEAEAYVGRLVAKRVIELLFLPQLKAWGFEPRIPVFTL